MCAHMLGLSHTLTTLVHLSVRPGLMAGDMETRTPHKSSMMVRMMIIPAVERKQEKKTFHFRVKQNRDDPTFWFSIVKKKTHKKPRRK